MNITIFDSVETLIGYNNKFADLRSYIFIADSVSFYIKTFDSVLHNTDFDTISNEQLFSLANIVYEKVPNTLKEIQQLEKYYEVIKKIKQIKHKDKPTVMIINNYQHGLTKLKNRMQTFYQEMYEHYKVGEFRQFAKDNIWQIPFVDVFSNEKKEDAYIQPICDVMLNHENMFGFDEIVDKKYSHAFLDTQDEADFEFIKIPILNLPVSGEMNYNQIKYTRDDLQPALIPFKAKLKELKEELFQLKFVPENISTIKTLCREKLIAQANAVQQSIDNSLYLSHQMHQSEEDTNSRLCLGVCSAAMLIDYLKKNSIVEPYVASEIRDRVERQMDLKSSYLFAYFMVHPSNQVQPYGEEN